MFKNKHARLVKTLTEYAELTKHNNYDELRKLSWFLYDRDEVEAAVAISNAAKTWLRNGDV